MPPYPDSHGAPSSPPAATLPVFSLHAVCVSRAGRTILDDVSLKLPSGCFTALIGPSGDGKTTLLRLLNRLDDPTTGNVELFAKAITSYPVRSLRRRVGFVFQTPVMFAGKVAENLHAADVFSGARPQPSATTASERLAAMLALAGLDASYGARNANDLSGGEKQRVALARALMTEPAVLLLDEPTAALDPEVADRLMQTLKNLNQTTGLTIVMVTHRLHEARSAATYVVMLEGGRVVEAGPAQTILNAPTEGRTKAFVRSGDGGRRNVA